MTHLREVIVVEIAMGKVAADDGTVCEAAAKSIGAVALDSTANLDRILPHDLSKVANRTAIPADREEQCTDNHMEAVEACCHVKD